MEFVGHLPRKMPDTIPCGLIIWTSLQDMFSCLTIFTAGTEVRITNFEFVEKMAAEAMVVRSKSEYNDLFLPGEAVIWIINHTLQVLILESVQLFGSLMFGDTGIKRPWFLVSMDSLLNYLESRL